MLTIGPGPDPYFAYKIHHVERAKTAWRQSVVLLTTSRGS